MSLIVKWWRAESALIASIIVALAGVITLPGSWEKILGALLPLIAGGAVRQTVWAPPAVQSAVQAAGSAVASQLTPDIAGAAGQVTTPAQAIVDGVVTGVLGR